MAVSRFSIDWRRVSRWSLIGATGLLIWFLWPVAQCSWGEFKGESLPTVEHHTMAPEVTDNSPQEGFFANLYESAAVCYHERPFSSQASWRRSLIYFLLLLGVISALLHRAYMRRRPTGY